MSAWLEWVKAFEGPGGVLVGVLGTKLFDRAKDKQSVELSEAQETNLDAQSAKTFAEAAAILVAPLRLEIADLRVRLDGLERENRFLRGLLAKHAPNLVLDHHD